MRNRVPAISILSLLCAGLISLALIPGGNKSDVAQAEQPRVAAVTSGGSASPNPKLLEALDDAVKPPLPQAQASAEAEVAELKATPSVPGATPTAPVAQAAALASPSVPANQDALASGRVGSSAVNLRAGPSSSAAKISVVQAGEPVQVGNTQGGWVQVTLSDGRSGWIYSSYLANGAAGAATGGKDLAAPPPQRTAVASTRAAAPAPAEPKPRAILRGGSELEDRTALIAEELPAYSRPSDGADSIFTLEAGQRVRIAQVRGDWVRVETPQGFSVWIRRSQ